MKKTLSVLTVFLFLSTIPLTADYYINQKSHSDEITVMGQTTPASDEINEMWLAQNKMAMHGKKQSIIMDLEKEVMYMIDHEDKTYVEMTLPLDISKYFPEQIQQMMSNITVKVTPTEETKTIGDWKCKGYDVAMNMMMMNIEMKVWATKDVPFDWKAYSSDIFPKIAKATMRLSDEAIQQFMKIDGFQIRTETTTKMMGQEMKSYQEVQEISEKSAPAGTYSVPEGYEQKEAFTMEDLRQKR